LYIDLKLKDKPVCRAGRGNKGEESFGAILMQNAILHRIFLSNPRG
jgi:hypothetical protein